MTAYKRSPGLLFAFLIALAIVGAIVAGIRLAGKRQATPTLPSARPQAAKPAADEPAPASGTADTVLLSVSRRDVPGLHPTTTLRYRNPGAKGVKLAGSWDYWSNPQAMNQGPDGVWTFETAGLGLRLGRYEFKFVVDGAWEPGDNRALYINLDGLIERPPDLIFSARLEAPDRIDVLFRRDVAHGADVRARLVPEIPVRSVVWRQPKGTQRTCGYAVGGPYVTFYMDEAFYGESLPTNATVTVAGTFNGWRTDGVSGLWQLRDVDNDGVWMGAVRMDELGDGTRTEPDYFKFVVNQRWLQPRMESPNAESDGKGSINLRLDPALSSATVLEVYTERPLDLTNHYIVVLENVEPRPAFREVHPGAVLDAVKSDRPLGAELTPEGVTFRLYAPRATQVDVELFATPLNQKPDGTAMVPQAKHPMQRGDDGVWEAHVAGARAGQYFAYRVAGPPGAGEGFNPLARVADPYARALAHGDNNAIVIDPAATNRWFGGWTNTSYRTPALADLVIYEAHVRDLTMDASSRVPAPLRGKYAGLLASTGQGTGLDHLRALGVNMIELMPVSEFANGTDRYDWGYGPAFYFAPEASYARDPLRGSQYYEFKHLVQELHQQGFAVVLDVVYNHIGSPNVFFMLDRKYYFRQDQDYNLQNFSGCGNDVRSEAPMMRRLIADNLLYWLREHKVDGFRFDLAELIDMDTLMAVQAEVRAEKPDVILISEPWSFRGDHRAKLKGTGWSAWNGDFRWAAQNFAKGQGDREGLRTQLRGCVDTWAATPLQAINYVESHDDKALADMLTTDAGGDGRKLTPLDAARNRLAATILFTAMGVPMISEGQEWIRSKHGLHNTFDQGDTVNALRWQERKRPAAAATLGYYRGLIHLRRSPAGVTFRWSQAVPDDYFYWIWPEDSRAFGYILNWTRAYPGKPFMVLLNGADKPVTFKVQLPGGVNWRLIGDGTKIDGRGIPAAPLGTEPDGARTITVPATSAWIYAGT